MNEDQLELDYDESDADSLAMLMEPSTIGEALEDYLKKLEIMSPDRRIVALSIPLGTDEDGNVPVVAHLGPMSDGRAN